LFDKEGQPVLAGWNRKILYHFSDTDEYWAMLVVDGRPEQPALGEIEDADIRITVSTETFVGLMNGTINGLKAVTTGKVKVKAAMSDMRKMQVFM
jgi:putative sterol carrier protein